MAIKKKPAKSTAKKTNNEDARKTLAALFDEADTADASNLLSVGEHKVRINGMLYKKDPKKGEAVRAEFEKLTGDEEGKKISQLYKLRDADGNKGPGLVYIKRDLELLDYKDISGKKFLKTLEKISEEQPMVIIRVADNGNYRNAFLQGLAEDGDDDEGESEGEGDEIEVGDRVTGTNDDGDDIEGEVKKIKGSKATVVDDDDEKHIIDVSDLEKVEEEAEEEEEKPKKKKGKKDEEPEEEEAEDDAIAVGDQVTGDNEDGDEVAGEVKKIKGDVVTVEDEDGDKHKCDIADLTKVEEDAEAEEEAEADEIAVGDTVTGENKDGDEVTGEVTKIKGKNATVEDEDGDSHVCPLDGLSKEEAEEEEEEEKPKKGKAKGKKKKEAEIEVGSKVTFEDDDGDDIEGEVKKIKGDKLIVEDDDGDEHKVDKDDATLVEED